jgi:subtilisin-like proprotein convertase family protein
VLTSSAGFIPFFGTSAAAPHAAAIAALLKSAVPNITPGQARQALQSSALDIRALGVDRDSGSGIVMAFNALEAAGANPSPAPLLKLARFEVKGSDGTAFVDPGEGGTLNVQLVNVGAAAATNVKATLTSATPGVTVTGAASDYPRIAAPGNATNSTPFAFTLAPGVPCGEAINLKLSVTAAELPAPATFDLTVQSGRPGAPVIVTYSGPRQPIPDNNADGVDVPLNITQFGGRLWDVNFRINGTICSTAAGATTVGLDHAFVGDLTLTLVSPQGTRVRLMNRPGGVFNGGRNFCGTLLDDESLAPWVQTIFPSGPQPLGAPYAGTLKPSLPLAAFKGEGANGVWVLNVTDSFSEDVGSVRSFSLVLTPAVCKR